LPDLMKRRTVDTFKKSENAEFSWIWGPISEILELPNQCVRPEFFFWGGGAFFFPYNCLTHDIIHGVIIYTIERNTTQTSMLQFKIFVILKNLNLGVLVA